MSEKYVVRLKNAAIYHADNPFGSTSAEKLMRRGEMVLSDVRKSTLNKWERNSIATTTFGRLLCNLPKESL